jgi:hypothetical protein
MTVIPRSQRYKEAYLANFIEFAGECEWGGKRLTCGVTQPYLDGNTLESMHTAVRAR